MPNQPPQLAAVNGDEHQLIRGVGLWGATTLNMIDMIGVGPFITIPLIIAAMGGPQAMLGWILGALLVVCDGWCGRSWARRCRARADRTVIFARSIDPNKLGRLMSFLFIWQLTFSAPLSIASGSIGLAQIRDLYFPAIRQRYKGRACRFWAMWKLMPCPSHWRRLRRWRSLSFCFIGALR
jgi:amino acid transporter